MNQLSNIDCELFCHSNSGHLQLIYTGFQVLARQKKITLSYRISKNFSTEYANPSPAELYVKVNNSKSLLFDMTDFGELRNDLLAHVDFYFKRSYSPKIVAEQPFSRKVYPLGLHYKVVSKYPNSFSLKRSLLEDSKKETFIAFFQELLGPINSIHPKLYRLHTDNCHSAPNLNLQPGVIFLANLWDPTRTQDKYRDEREFINQMRVDCVQKLRKEFGKRFIGGIIPNEYSKKTFAESLLEDPRLCIFGNYIRLLRKYPIGIATTGLHKSIGWKFAEYIAFSRAIVSEKLCYSAPNLISRKHYLDFTTPEECVDQVTKLIEDKPLRDQMMIDNHEYFNVFLRPDKLVWNALSIALGQNT